MHEKQTTATQTAVTQKLTMFFKGFIVGLRTFPRYVARHFYANRKARRKEVATLGTGRHNARGRYLGNGWFAQCQRVPRGAAA